LNEEFRPPVSLRVRTESLDRLLSSVGEVVLASTQLRGASREAATAESARLGAELDRMDHVLGDLGRRALELRTAPLLRIAENLPRLARELGLSLGKRVSLELDGEELELDRSILDRLADPLLHLIRNSVAHGIESPEERLRRGKPEMGSIRVEARRVHDAIEIAVVDDGAGVDVDAVRARAVAAGLLSADLAEDLPPSEVARLAFQHGLSTATTVSELAGRGVGLDAVRATVEAMGGEVDLISEAGRGTTALLRVRLSAAVQRVILIGVGEERLAIPITRVERIEEIDSAEIERAGGEAFVLIDGHPLPLLELTELLSLEPAAPAPRTMVLLAELHGQRTALRFDRLLGQQEIFVKPVPRLLLGLRAVCGLTLAADGRPVFLIEPAQLI
jgi:two-component system chemotaxis sensor kinase CheA